jgi:hypothetical protein
VIFVDLSVVEESVSRLRGLVQSLGGECMLSDDPVLAMVSTSRIGNASMKRSVSGPSGVAMEEDLECLTQ